MSAVLLGQHEPNTEPWYELRAGGIGASEIAAVVGLSPYVSAFWLWHFKKGNITGANPDNPLFYWGHALEPVVAARFAELHPGYVVETTGTWGSEDQPWQLANPDRLLTDEAGYCCPLEIKTTRYGDGWGPSGTDQIPLHVRCQVMQQMDVFGDPHAWVAVLIGGSEYREYRIAFDADDARTLREAGAAFWESLQNDTEPPIDCSDSTYKAVRALHPEIDRELDIEIGELWDEYEGYADIRDDADEKLRGVKARILAAMGTARIATANDQPVLRRQMSSAGTPYLKEIA